MQEFHQNKEMRDDEIDLLEYWRILWRRKWIVAGICTIAVTGTMILSLLQDKYYKSETVIISTSSDAGGLGTTLSSIPIAGIFGGGGVQSPADKIMVILKSRTTTESIVKRFDLLRLFNEDIWDAGRKSWKNPEKPPLMTDAVRMLTRDVAKFSKSKEGAITISVEWKDPKLAADIANYYVFALTEFLKDKSMNITIQTVDRAIPAERKSKPKIRQNMMLAGVTSLFLSVFVVFAVEYIHKLRAQG